jgi:HK97 gp10 family phage protein
MMGGSTATLTVLDRRQPYQVSDPVTAQVANTVVAAARAHTPHRTGRLASGWHVQQRRTADYAVTNSVPYARFVEYGTKDMRAEPMLGPVVMQARARYG